MLYNLSTMKYVNANNSISFPRQQKFTLCIPSSATIHEISTLAFGSPYQEDRIDKFFLDDPLYLGCVLLNFSRIFKTRGSAYPSRASHGSALTRSEPTSFFPNPFDPVLNPLTGSRSENLIPTRIGILILRSDRNPIPVIRTRNYLFFHFFNFSFKKIKANLRNPSRKSSKIIFIPEIRKGHRKINPINIELI